PARLVANFSRLPVVDDRHSVTQRVLVAGAGAQSCPHRKHCECNNVENVLGAVLTGKQPFSGRTAGFSRNLHTDLIRALAFGPRFGQLAVPERCELTMFLLQLFERLKFDLRVVLLDLLLYLSLFGLSFGASNQGASMRSG